MAEKEVKSKGLFDTICEATKEQIDELRRGTNRKKLKARVKSAHTKIEDKVSDAIEAIRLERQKIKENFELYSIDVIIDNVLEIHCLTGINFYTDKKGEIPTHRYIIEQEHQVLFVDKIDG